MSIFEPKDRRLHEQATMAWASITRKVELKFFFQMKVLIEKHICSIVSGCLGPYGEMFKAVW